MHTPRLCIDARAAADFAYQGLLAQEVIDQLVSAGGEPDASTEWIEKARTVLITHPGQVFAGQLRRFDTRRRVGRSPFYWVWERHFVKHAAISAFHRFRPIDRLSPGHKCQTVTTVLPPAGRMPFFLSRKGNQRFVVPSQKDALLLEKQYGVPESRIVSVPPGVRRFVHFTEGPRQTGEGTIVFLAGPGSDGERAIPIISALYPQLVPKVLPLKRRMDLSPKAWLKELQGARLFVYLTKKPFDWPTLALETLYWGIPTVFSDEHNALTECLPQSRLRLSRFLADQPDLGVMKKLAEDARFTLFKKGLFDALLLARQYKDIYSRITPTTSFDAQPTA